MVSFDKLPFQASCQKYLGTAQLFVINICKVRYRIQCEFVFNICFLVSSLRDKYWDSFCHKKKYWDNTTGLSIGTKRTRKEITSWKNIIWNKYFWGCKLTWNKTNPLEIFTRKRTNCNARTILPSRYSTFLPHRWMNKFEALSFTYGLSSDKERKKRLRSARRTDK